LIEKNQTDENETRIREAAGRLEKYKQTSMYSCNTCGNTFDANPPGDVHNFSSVYPCWKFDWIERSYRCNRCSRNIKLFWHPKVHKHHDYTTFEEIERKTSKDTQGNYPHYAQRMRGY
jgi:DNA-directed RNA polymerase subunit RPC12/RpoP